MKKLINKIIAGTMAAAIALSTGVTAFAADTQQITPGNTGSTTVKANVESEAVVWLPTNITLSGVPDENKKYTGEGAVIVEGDIAGNEYISVTPESSISLKQSGKDDIVAQVTQEKTTFTYDDIQNANSAVTSISADTLSAGEWNSVLHYNVSLDENPLPPGYTTLYEYDLSATEADDVKAYYMVPNKNTSPIEVETQASQSKSRAAVTSDQTEADNIIEYNGIRYVLSDEDELVISGEGEMKENIQADLTNYVGLYADVANKFGYKYLVYTGVPNIYHGYDLYYDGKVIDTEPAENEILMLFGKNSIQPTFTRYKEGFPINTVLPDDIENYDEIMEYINSIKSKYTIFNVREITISDGVTNISKEAFYKCSTLEKVSIGNSVTHIDEDAFFGCTSLTEVIIPNSVTELGETCFRNCTSLKNITFGTGLTAIPYRAFYNCENLTSISFPENIKSVGREAFGDCNRITEIHINAPISLSSYTFGNHPVRDFYIDDINDLLNSSIYQSDSGGNNFFTNLYLNDNLVTEVTIPDGTQEVKNLFFPCIEKVNFPDTVTSIGAYAFHGSGITDLNLPNSVQSIGSNAYWACRNLTVIDDLPSQLTTIGSGAFERCANLTKVIIPDSVTTIYSGAFRGCEKLVDVSLPKGITELPQDLFSLCSSLESITIPDSVTTVRPMVFGYCTNLIDVQISDGTLKAIGDSGLLNSVFLECPCKDALVERYNTLNS